MSSATALDHVCGGSVTSSSSSWKKSSRGRRSDMYTILLVLIVFCFILMYIVRRLVFTDAKVQQLTEAVYGLLSERKSLSGRRVIKNSNVSSRPIWSIIIPTTSEMSSSLSSRKQTSSPTVEEIE